VLKKRNHIKSTLIHKVFTTLLKAYGPQGWWPFINYEGYYHPNNYQFPRNTLECFEVCLGSILTQNTTFTSVVKSLNNLNEQDALSAEKIKTMDLEVFKECIKPSGYYNQKADYILEFISFFEALEDSIPSRDALLKVRGIGEETADSILLFAYNQPEFKIDAYTKRVLIDLGLVDENVKYQQMKALMQEELQGHYKSTQEQVILYQEYHALLVAHAKQFYSKKPYGKGSFLRELKP